VFSPLKTPEDQSVDAAPFAGREEELATAAEDAIAVVPRTQIGWRVLASASTRRRVSHRATSTLDYAFSGEHS